MYAEKVRLKYKLIQAKLLLLDVQKHSGLRPEFFHLIKSVPIECFFVIFIGITHLFIELTGGDGGADFGSRGSQEQFILFQRVYDDSSDPLSLVFRMHEYSCQAALRQASVEMFDRTGADYFVLLADDIHAGLLSYTAYLFRRMLLGQALHLFQAVIFNIDFQEISLYEGG